MCVWSFRAGKWAVGLCVSMYVSCVWDYVAMLDVCERDRQREKEREGDRKRERSVCAWECVCWPIVCMGVCVGVCISGSVCIGMCVYVRVCQCLCKLHFSYFSIFNLQYHG